MKRDREFRPQMTALNTMIIIELLLISSPTFVAVEGSGRGSTLRITLTLGRCYVT